MAQTNDKDPVVVTEVRSWDEIVQDLIEEKKGLWERLYKRDLYGEGETVEDKQNVRNS